MNLLARAVEAEYTSDDVIAEGFLIASVKNVGTGGTVTVNGVALAEGEAKDYDFVGKPYEEIPLYGSRRRKNKSITNRIMKRT